MRGVGAQMITTCERHSPQSRREGELRHARDRLIGAIGDRGQIAEQERKRHLFRRVGLDTRDQPLRSRQDPRGIS